ncbi:MAG: hypothetical protein HYZ68_05080 [Chloroflexi bacterium]|nr:hypothetical protein [Chloroflexota bacterium]
MQVIIHPLNEDSYVGEIEALPGPGETFLKVSSPHKPDGKPLTRLNYGVNTILVPLHRINFIELLEEATGLPGPQAAKMEEKEFVREPQILFYRD